MFVILTSIYLFYSFLFFNLILSGSEHSNSSFPNSKSVSLDSIMYSDEVDALSVPDIPRFYILHFWYKRRWRLLQAFHCPAIIINSPRFAGLDRERLELSKHVKFEAVMREIGNVMVRGKANLVTD
ncbi:Hypothetical predicted protein [Olea europaea subsp. europaea]|uniref:Uncharacterized protein n=1 Tax=Olea europaea subsp. europaea TaxID=158383 RepID=A0A8S0UVY7_OLEEU|nr:Hypothetical predicted protein [Olea europaea subsp. europaea]